MDSVDDADVVATAKAAGLRYVHDGQPGFCRRRTGRMVRVGKRSLPDFAIEDVRHHVVRDDATVRRIRQLAIPPAWERVWICADPRGHVQATGRDARGRKQYRYHPRWRSERDQTKYARMIEFGRALPLIRRQIAADMRLTGLPRQKVLATVVKLLETTLIRVGNEEYARTNKSFGLTTLKDRHVDIRQSDVRFHFRGKSGVTHEIAVHDPAIARIVRRCRDLPGQELFQYVDSNGDHATIGSADVNDYIHAVAGHDFTAKDFRTWAGTMLAAQVLCELDATPAKSDVRRRLAQRPRRNSKDVAAARRRPTNADVVRAIRRVATQLGNTPSVCRKCYVHPEVIAAYLDGTLASAFTRAGHRPGHAIPQARTRNGTFGIREEAALIALLRGRLAEQKAGTRLEHQLRRSLSSAA